MDITYVYINAGIIVVLVILFLIWALFLRKRLGPPVGLGLVLLIFAHPVAHGENLKRLLRYRKGRKEVSHAIKILISVITPFSRTGKEV
jgi:hypothetical protein